MGFKQKFLMFLRHQLCYQWRLYQNYLGTFMWIVAIHIFLIYYSRFSPFLPSSPFPAFLVAANWISNTQEVSSSAQKCGNWKISVSSFSEVLLSELLSPSCLTLCHPMDCSLPGSSVHGIFQAIVLEWIAISFSRGSSQPRAQIQVSHIVDRCFTLWATREVTPVQFLGWEVPLEKG